MRERERGISVCSPAKSNSCATLNGNLPLPIMEWEQIIFSQMTVKLVSSHKEDNQLKKKRWVQSYPLGASFIDIYLSFDNNNNNKDNILSKANAIYTKLRFPRAQQHHHLIKKQILN